MSSKRQCRECNQIFDLTIPAEADEFFAGHDCFATEEEV